MSVFSLFSVLYSSMATARLLKRISVENYLAAEATSNVKHEYVKGDIYTIAKDGISKNITAKVFSFFQKHLVPFYSVGTDQHLQVNAKTFYYPSILVRAEKNLHIVTEVFTEESEGLVRREKLLNYLKMPSLQTYLLIDSQKRSVTRYERSEEGWLESTIENTGNVAFDCLKTSLSLSNIYRGVSFESA